MCTAGYSYTTQQQQAEAPPTQAPSGPGGQGSVGRQGRMQFEEEEEESGEEQSESEESEELEDGPHATLSGYVHVHVHDRIHGVPQERSSRAALHRFIYLH